MPLIEDRSRPSSMAVASRCTTAPIAAVPAIGGYWPVGAALGHQRLHQLGPPVRHSAPTLRIAGQRPTRPATPEAMANRKVAVWASP